MLLYRMNTVCCEYRLSLHSGSALSDSNKVSYTHSLEPGANASLPEM